LEWERWNCELLIDAMQMRKETRHPDIRLFADTVIALALELRARLQVRYCKTLLRQPHHDSHVARAAFGFLP
jgi:hypothetical protein